MPGWMSWTGPVTDRHAIDAVPSTGHPGRWTSSARTRRRPDPRATRPVGAVLTVDSLHTVHAAWPGGVHWGLLDGVDSWEKIDD